jgi:hypothetical protein
VCGKFLVNTLTWFSHRYAAQIKKKLDVFWDLPSHKVRSLSLCIQWPEPNLFFPWPFQVIGILNALPMAESLAALVQDAGEDSKAGALAEVVSIKAEAKRAFHVSYIMFLHILMSLIPSQPPDIARTLSNIRLML